MVPLDEEEAKSTVPALICTDAAINVPVAPKPMAVVPEEAWVKVPFTVTVPALLEISHMLDPFTCIFP